MLTIKYHKEQSTSDNLRAVVATLLHTQQINIPADTIETEIVTNRNYPSLESACSSLNTWGVPNMPVRIGMSQLASAPLPAIAHLHSGIFVLVQAVGKDSVQYWDTAKGNKEVSLQEFEQSWSGAMPDVMTIFAPALLTRLVWAMPLPANRTNKISNIFFMLFFV